jgi:hypothetical protein
VSFAWPLIFLEGMPAVIHRNRECGEKSISLQKSPRNSLQVRTAEKMVLSNAVSQVGSASYLFMLISLLCLLFCWRQNSGTDYKENRNSKKEELEGSRAMEFLGNFCFLFNFLEISRSCT